MDSSPFNATFCTFFFYLGANQTVESYTAVPGYSLESLLLSRSCLPQCRRVSPWYSLWLMKYSRFSSTWKAYCRNSTACWIRSQVTARYINWHQMITSRSQPGSRIQPANQGVYVGHSNQSSWVEQPVFFCKQCPNNMLRLHGVILIQLNYHKITWL